MNWLYADCGDDITTAGDFDERSMCPTLLVVLDDGWVKSKVKMNGKINKIKLILIMLIIS